MRHHLSYAQSLIGILLAVLAIETLCSAQEWPGNGMGNTPMPQSAPISPDSRQRPVVPGAPMKPAVTSRPADWPGRVEPEASPWVPPDQQSQAPTGEVKPCDGIRILARVGSEAILESEVIGTVNEMIETNKDRIPPDQIEKQREMLIQAVLKRLIQTKLIYQDARRTIPSEGWPHIEKQLTKQFEEVQLEKMMKKSGVSSAHEFDLKLRTLGTSLEREKRAFIERTLAEQWGRQQVKRDEEITYDQMLGYYYKHQDEFTSPAAAKWEELMVRYSKHPNKAAAHEAIARMGNQIVFSGAPFAEVAKAGSDGATATDGGLCPQTTKGALACQALDDALFSLPVGQMSPIIAGDKGYHIVRVIERKEAEVAPFLAAQVDIREKIVNERSQNQFREYLAKIEARTPVWTIYDSKDGSLQLATPPSQQPIRR